MLLNIVSPSLYSWLRLLESQNVITGLPLGIPRVGWQNFAVIARGTSQCNIV